MPKVLPMSLVHVLPMSLVHVLPMSLVYTKYATLSNFENLSGEQSNNAFDQLAQTIGNDSYNEDEYQ